MTTDDAAPAEALTIEPAAELQIEPGKMLPSLRTLGPNILIAGILPVIAYAFVRPHVSSDATGLAIVLVIPVVELIVERIRHRRFEPIGIISMVGLAIGLAGAVAFHGNDLLLKLRESVITGIIGLVFLLSLLAQRPAIFYAGRMFATGGDSSKNEQFGEIWHRPGAARRFRRITAMWGVGLLGETIARTAAALAMPTQEFLIVAPILGFGTIGTLIYLSARGIKAGEAEALAAEAA